MKKKVVQSLVAILLLAAIPAAMAEAEPELTKVTLEIDGLICSACVDTVEDALKAVDGVREAHVSLSNSEAMVTFDSSKCKTDDLIKALENAQGMTLYHYCPVKSRIESAS